VLFSAFLVFFMHAGFALLEAGFCQRTSAVVVLTKNFAVVSLASILYFLVGFGLMFGDGGQWLGLSGFMPNVGDTLMSAPEGMPTYVFLFFQMVFAATAATIVSGAVAERARVIPFMLFVGIASALIYPIVGHWVWGGGLLSSWGFHDFAGSTVVHAVGGGMAIAGILAVGPRLGRYNRGEEPRHLPAHNLPLAALGVLILWLGWFGFNGGSTLAADPVAIGEVILATNLAASAGFGSSLLYVYTRQRRHKLDLAMGMNGALCGLVAITAGADVIGPVDAIVVGAIAGILVVECTNHMDRLRLDDPVGAVPVHLMGGVFGTLAVGLFANHGDTVGLLHGGGVSLLGIQAAGAALGTLFAFLCGAAVWFGLKMSLGVRVDAEHEQHGLDFAECGVHAYHMGDAPTSVGPF
jgi:Amt family ammonium transporter